MSPERTRGKRLAPCLDRLEKLHGPPERPPSTEPFALVLWENVVYLASDEKRAEAFAKLRREVGHRPEEILSAPKESLFAIASAGIKPEIKVEAMREAARIAVEELDSDVKSVLNLPDAKAIQALKRFPSIGGPGAEKILLFSRAKPLFALESNGLRVLLRLGYGTEQKSYQATYRSAREASAAEIRNDVDWLIRAHQLLRRHGQEICKRSAPICESCPLQDDCQYFSKRQI